MTLDRFAAREFPTNRQTRVYIAGPMRGIRYFNFPEFDEAKRKLELEGYAVVSPADLDRKRGFEPADLEWQNDFNWHGVEITGLQLNELIKRDVEHLLECDMIYMLSGWKDSLGATAEKALADWMGIPVIFQVSPEEAREIQSAVDNEIPSLSEVIDGGGDGDDSDSGDDEDILEEALRITRGDRNASYGPPDQDFERTARIWSAIKGVDFEAREVAMFMVALKLSRETHQRKRDNWVDIAGYARCGSLCR